MGRDGLERRAQRSLQNSGAWFDSRPTRQPSGLVCEDAVLPRKQREPVRLRPGPRRKTEPVTQRSALIATQRGGVRLASGSPGSPFGRTPTRSSEGRSPRSTRGGEAELHRGMVAGATGGATSRPRVVRFHCLGPRTTWRHPAEWSATGPENRWPVMSGGVRFPLPPPLESEPAEVPGLFAEQSGRRKALRCKPSSLRCMPLTPRKRGSSLVTRTRRVRVPRAALLVSR